MLKIAIIGFITATIGAIGGHIFAYEQALLHVKQNSKYSCVLTLESEMP
jgi:hypothetical protein